MKQINATKFSELSHNEAYNVCGGDGLGLGDWVTDWFDSVGQALHDWFGCVKCGLHFF